MMRNQVFALLGVFSLMSGGCNINPTLRHTPDEYAKLRGVEIVTQTPSRPFEVLISTKASGGRHTSIDTMINAMIDDAKQAGADAIIPLAGADERPNRSGIAVFTFLEEGKTVTWARAVKWTASR